MLHWETMGKTDKFAVYKYEVKHFSALKCLITLSMMTHIKKTSLYNDWKKKNIALKINKYEIDWWIFLWSKHELCGVLGGRFLQLFPQDYFSTFPIILDWDPGMKTEKKNVFFNVLFVIIIILNFFM